MSPNEQTLRDVMGAILGLAPSDISENTAMGQCDAWESITHITLVLAVEERFGLSFSEADIPELTTFPKLLAAVEGEAA